MNKSQTFIIKLQLTGKLVSDATAEQIRKDVNRLMRDWAKEFMQPVEFRCLSLTINDERLKD